MDPVVADILEADDLRKTADALAASSPTALIVGGATIPLSPAASEIVRVAISALANAGSAEIAIHQRLLTVTEAASLLHTSESSVESLIANGHLVTVQAKLPYEMVAAFQQRRRAASLDHLRLIEEFPDPPMEVEDILKAVQESRSRKHA